ncbi:MAG TPA: BON domain-containing protein [Desulfobacteraceae bacterium]|nr:BON domain-containing protein [Desulfobacteraceae bacterium]
MEKNMHLKMKRTYSAMLVLLTAVMLAWTAAAETAGEPDEQHSDTWIKSKLVTTYTLNRHLNPFDIKVDVKEGVVTLEGTVDSAVERDLAVEIAKGMTGVSRVDDKLSIESGAAGDSAELPDFSRLVEDATVTAMVKSRLLWNRNIQGMDINVDTSSGEVVLDGKVESDAVRDLAGQIALNTENVRKVVNNLEVTGKKEPSKLEEAGKIIEREVSDSWITGKVKAVLLSSKEVEGADVRVSTRNKVVTLKGTARSSEQADRIVALVADIVGVAEVKSELAAGEQ